MKVLKDFHAHIVIMMDGTLEVNLKSHITQNHSKTFTCSICEYKVAKESILMNHFSQFHGIKIKEGEK